MWSCILQGYLNQGGKNRLGFIIFLREEDDTLIADKEVTTCALLFENLLYLKQKNQPFGDDIGKFWILVHFT